MLRRKDIPEGPPCGSDTRVLLVWSKLMLLWKLYDSARSLSHDISIGVITSWVLAMRWILLSSPKLPYPLSRAEMSTACCSENLSKAGCRVQMYLLARGVLLSYSEAHKSHTGHTVPGETVSASLSAQHRESRDMLVSCQFDKVAWATNTDLRPGCQQDQVGNSVLLAFLHWCSFAPSSLDQVRSWPLPISPTHGDSILMI